jgi:hypothetical protein
LSQLFRSREPTHCSQAIFSVRGVRGPHQVALVGARGREDALELQTGDHVGVTSIAVGFVIRRGRKGRTPAPGSRRPRRLHEPVRSCRGRPLRPGRPRRTGSTPNRFRRPGSAGPPAARRLRPGPAEPRRRWFCGFRDRPWAWPGGRWALPSPGPRLPQRNQRRSRPAVRSSPLKKRRMDSAAVLPAAMASTTVLGPVTASPPAKMSASPDCRVTGSTFMVPQSLRVQAHSSVRQAQSDSWPMAGTTASTSMVNSDPATGSGRRRPDSSGSPSCMRMHSMAVTRPSCFDHPHRIGQGHDVDAFLAALLDLLGAGRHLRLAAAVDDEGLF